MSEDEAPRVVWETPVDAKWRVRLVHVPATGDTDERYATEVCTAYDATRAPVWSDVSNDYSKAHPSYMARAIDALAAALGERALSEAVARTNAESESLDAALVAAVTNIRDKLNASRRGCHAYAYESELISAILDGVALPGTLRRMRRSNALSIVATVGSDAAWPVAREVLRAAVVATDPADAESWFREAEAWWRMRGAS